MWIDNDEGSLDMWRERATETLEDVCNNASDDETAEDRRQEAAYQVANMLKAEFEEGAESLGLTGFWVDLVNSALSEVDWNAIAEAMVANLEMPVQDNE